MSPPNHHPSPPPEKSKFLQTCNRLSLFLKAKGKIRDLNFGINAKFDATGTGLFDSVRSLKSRNLNSPCQSDAGAAAAAASDASPAKPATVDLLSSVGEKPSQVEEEKPLDVVIPQYVILDSSCELEDKVEAVTKPKSSTAQLTIFYEGQVLVLDNVPADRARDLMLMAKNGAETSKPPPVVVVVSRSKEVQQAKDSDLPIARRAWLHKFLAKRKDRATVRAPYQSPSPDGSSSGNERSFDLNL